MDEDDERTFKSVRNKFILMAIVIAVVLFITTRVFVIDFICWFLFSIFLFIILILCILFIG